MAFKKQVAVVRRAPSVPKKRYEALVRVRQASAKRLKEVGAKRIGVLVGAATGYGVGYIEANQKLEAKFTSPAALGAAGFVASFVLPGLVKGKGGVAAAECGAALLGIALYKAGLGQPLIGEDDSVEGDWQ